MTTERKATLTIDGQAPADFQIMTPTHGNDCVDIRTLGGKFYKIRPVHGFASQLTSGIVILAASMVGLPVSTTQVVSSSIIGVGASERFGKVRWGVAGDILTAWIITIPISALFSAGIFSMLQYFKISF